MATEYVTHREFEALRTEVRGEFALVRGEMKELHGEVLGRFGKVDGELGRLRGELESLRSRVDDLPTTTKVWAANVTTMLGFGAFVLAAVKLG